MQMKKDNAVSPVVGVMLMLVVTIIIAAVVAVFASGVISTDDAPAQVLLKGTYSQSQGMTITHAGGDAVSFTDTDFMTTPSEVMGKDAAKFAWKIDKSILINTADDKNLNESSASAFKPGDMLYVAVDNCLESGKPDPGVNANAQKFGSDSNAEIYLAPYQFGNPANIGSYFYLDLVDKAGSVIARTKVTITS